VTKALSPEQIRAQFDLGYHLKHVDTIFARVFGSAGRSRKRGARGRRGK